MLTSRVWRTAGFAVAMSAAPTTVIAVAYPPAKIDQFDETGVAEAA
jgi:hypothetical protein